MARPINPNSKRQLAIAKKAADEAAGIHRQRGRPATTNVVKNNRDKKSYIEDLKKEIRIQLESIAHPILTVSRDSKLNAKAVEWVNKQLDNRNTRTSLLNNLKGVLRYIDDNELAQRRQGRGFVTNLSLSHLKKRLFRNKEKYFNKEVTAHKVLVTQDPTERLKMAEEATNNLTVEDRMMILEAARQMMDRKKENKRFCKIMQDVRKSISVRQNSNKQGPNFKFIYAKHDGNSWGVKDLSRVVIETLKQSKVFTPTTNAKFIIKVYVEKQILMDGVWETVFHYPHWVSMNVKDNQMDVRPPFVFNQAFQDKFDASANNVVEEWSKTESDGHSIRFLFHNICLDTFIISRTHAGGCLVNGCKDKVAMFGTFKARNFRSSHNNCLIACLTHATNKKIKQHDSVRRLCNIPLNTLIMVNSEDMKKLAKFYERNLLVQNPIHEEAQDIIEEVMDELSCKENSMDGKQPTCQCEKSGIDLARYQKMLRKAAKKVIENKKAVKINKENLDKALEEIKNHKDNLAKHLDELEKVRKYKDNLDKAVKKLAVKINTNKENLSKASLEVSTAKIEVRETKQSYLEKAKKIVTRRTILSEFAEDLSD